MHAVPAAGLCRKLSQVVLSQRDSLLKRSPVTTLLIENRLNEYLHRVDYEAREAVLKITEEIAVSHGIDEHRKTADPIHWVQEMNAAKHDAEEIVMGNYFA